jgi:hypothetical protein
MLAKFLAAAFISAARPSPAIKLTNVLPYGLISPRDDSAAVAAGFEVEMASLLPDVRVLVGQAL